MYRSIPEIIEELQERKLELEQGKMTLTELGVMVDHARELYERLVMIKYKALESEVKKQAQQQPEKGSKPKIRFSAPEIEVPQNQTSLIDAIEEQEDLLSQQDAVIEAQEEQRAVPTFDHTQESEVVEAAVEEEQADQEEAVEQQVEEEKSVEPEAIEEVSVEEPEIQEPVQEELSHQPDPIPEPAVEDPEPMVPKDDLGEGEEHAEERNMSLNELLVNEEESLATKLSKTPIATLSGAIGLNQKFLFINDLFGGDADLFSTTVTALDGFGAEQEAQTYIQDLAQRFEWDEESKSVKNFRDLVERRFLN